MSSGALPHYQARAQELGIGLPIELSGQPLSLLAENSEDPRLLAVHNLKSPLALEVAGKFRGVVETAAGFILKGSDEAGPAGLITPTTVRGDTYLAAVTSRLVPANLKTGHFHSMRAEAVAPDEVPEEALAGFTPAARRRVEQALGDTMAGAVCLVVSGDLKARNMEGTTHSLTVVAAELGKQGIRVIAYLGAGFADNIQFGSRVRGTSALYSGYVPVRADSLPPEIWRTKRPDFSTPLRRQAS